MFAYRLMRFKYSLSLREKLKAYPQIRKEEIQMTGQIILLINISKTKKTIKKKENFSDLTKEFVLKPNFEIKKN